MIALALMATLGASEALARRNEVFDPKTPKNPNDIIYGGRGVTGKSVAAGIISLILPGVGQLIDEHKPGKAAVHFILGLPVFLGSVIGPGAFVFGLWHIWSGWDALIDRPGGYLDGLVGIPNGSEILDASLGICAANIC